MMMKEYLTVYYDTMESIKEPRRIGVLGVMQGTTALHNMLQLSETIENKMGKGTI